MILSNFISRVYLSLAPYRPLSIGNWRQIDFTMGTKCSNFLAFCIILTVLFLHLKYLDVRTSLLEKHYGLRSCQVCLKNAKQGLSIINAMLIINSSQTQKSQGESGLPQSWGSQLRCYEGCLSTSPLQGSLAFIFSSMTTAPLMGFRKAVGRRVKHRNFEIIWNSDTDT